MSVSRDISIRLAKQKKCISMKRLVNTLTKLSLMDLVSLHLTRTTNINFPDEKLGEYQLILTYRCSSNTEPYGSPIAQWVFTT